MVKINTTNIYQKEYDDVRMEYGEIVQESIITKVNDMKLDEV